MFKPAGNTLSTIIIGYSFLVIVGILFIRFRNKSRSADQGTRRQQPRLRLMLNILLIAGLAGTMAIISWDLWSFLKFENIPSYIPATIIFSVLYLWVLNQVIKLIRARNKNTERASGEERRRLRWLRHTLNVMIVAPVVVTVGILIYNLLL
jgi:hypothetical protein